MRRSTEKAMNPQYLALAILVAVVAVFVLGFVVTRTLLDEDAGNGIVAPAATVGPPTGEPVATETPGARMPLDVKIGQLVMPRMAGTAAEGAAELVRVYHIGNMVLLADNVESPQQVLSLTSGLQAMAQDANGAGMLIAIDQEGGRVIRLGPPFTQMPAAAVIGCIGQTEFARQSALVTGREMLAVGINVNLAPVADVLTNPENTVIGDRAYGTTPDAVTPMVLAYIEGLHQAGVLATTKHFPGHGSAGGDSHDGRIVVEKTLAELEADDLPPFRAAASETDLMMTSNVDYTTLDPAGIPASLSKPTVDFLRASLGFEGVVATDALEMGAVSNRWDAGEAAVRAIEAGADIVLYADADGGVAAAQALLGAVRAGRISEERVDASVARVLALKERALAQPLPGLEVVGSAEHAAFTELLSQARKDTGC
ncbi:MAG TPA: glycoside hydrolase family 3 protein [Dehalococcoidia bacterium]|nr:glycoside hydrolase family 3 protein [Dehalococcoidia bacterium]